MLKSVVQMDTEPSNSISDPLSLGESSPMHRTRSASSYQPGQEELSDKLDRSLNISSSPAARRTNSIYITPFVATVKARTATNADVTDMNSSLTLGVEEMGIIQGIVELDGDKLVALTRNRPELAEYLALEIQNLKLRRPSEMR